MKKLNKKGLTLIELLVVIVIIVIISLLVIPSVINMLGKNKNEKYKNYENLLVENMKLYRIDNSENLGDNIDTHLSLNILKSANPDIKLDNCVVDDLYIKNSEYNVCLRCGYDEKTKKYEYESKYCETANVPYGNPPTTTTLVKEVKTTPASGYLNDGNDIKIEVILSKQVTGTNPTLTILAGNNNKTLTGVLEGNKLVYNYTVKNGDNGKFNVVSLNGGSLKDIENNEEVNLELPVISSSITLDTIEPTCNITLTNKRVEQGITKVDLKVVGSDTNLASNSYSFDNKNYNDVTVKTVIADGNYKAYVKDLANNVGMCSKLVYIKNDNLDTSGANNPVLASNMIPVYYDEQNDVWRKADASNTDKTNQWYSYNSTGDKKGMWANAVTVTETNRSKYLNAKVGTEISMDDINTMWVWIPRFNATTPSNYNGGTKDNPRAIDVTFVKANETAIDAFTFGTKQLSGFWYAKFETGHSTLTASTTDNNLGCSNERCSNANGIIIKPNVTSLRYNNISNFFYASRSMEQTGNSFGFVSSEVDTHMSKNNEWGAVAYLTQSIYGRCTSSTTCSEVYINNSREFYTGRSGGAAGKTPINGTYTDQTSTTNYNTYGFYTYDDYLLNYNTNTKGNKVKGKGTGASTTGTIYGIYDMSGGTFEYVMGVYNRTINKSGFSSFPDTKYYNNYTGTTYTGHALTETAGWYSDIASFVESEFSWVGRGGGSTDSISAGVFGYTGGFGAAADIVSNHFVITNE